MKKYLLTLACTTFLGQGVQAESFIGNQTLKDKTYSDLNIMGNANLSNIKADEISIIGNVEFHNLTGKETNFVGDISKSDKGTLGSLKVVGEVEATDVTVESLEIAGTVTITGLTVAKDASIVGNLTLKASKDPKVAKNKLNNLTIGAEKIILEDTEVSGNITVTNKKGIGDQVLQLIGNTTVKGTIKFESGKGKIEQGPDAKIEGQLTGATVAKK